MDDKSLAQIVRDLEELAAGKEICLTVRGTWDDMYASLRVGSGPEFEAIEEDDITSALAWLMQQFREWQECRQERT